MPEPVETGEGPAFDSPSGYILHDLRELKRSWPGGISFGEIAKRSGLTKAHVVRLFNGNGNTTVETLQVIAGALNRTLSFELLPVPDHHLSTQLVESGEGETDRERADRLEVECRELEDANRSLAKMRDKALEGNLSEAQPVETQGAEEGLDDLREIVARCCEACSKGDNPESLAAYLWSNISAHLASGRAEGQS